MRLFHFLILAAIAAFVCSTALAVPEQAAKKATALGFTMKDIDGKEVDLGKYAGKVVMIVNVASKCGHTPQYAKLEALYEKYKDKGFVILGFPANNFKSQEPGSDEDIKAFCTKNYGVTFDMFSKISVLGEDKAPLYQFLTSKEKDGQFGGEIQWNFTKFLLNRHGEVVGRFEPKTKPDEPDVVKAIETALAEAK